MSFIQEYSWMRRTTPTSSAQVREIINVLAECDRVFNPNYTRDKSRERFNPNHPASKRKIRYLRMYWALKNKGR